MENQPTSVVKADHFVQQKLKKKKYNTCHPSLNQYCRNASASDIVVLKMSVGQ